MDTSGAANDQTARHRLRRQFGALATGRVVAAALSFLWLAVAARELQLPEFADLALLLSVGAMTSVVADWGFPLVLNETVAADPESARSALAMVIRRRLLLACAAAGAMAVFYFTAANDRSIAVPGIFAVSMVASSWYTSCSAALRGVGVVGPEAFNEVASRLFVLLVGGTLVISGRGLVAVVLAYATADVLSATALTVLARRRLSAGVPVDRVRFRSNRMLPLGLASLTGIVYYRIDVWLLALIALAGEVAQYSVCYRLLDALVLPAGALAVLGVGRTARLDYVAAVSATDRLARALCLALTPAVIALEVFAEPVLRLAFGDPYSDAAPVLQILSLAVLPSAAALVWAPLLALRGRGLLSVTVVSLAVNVVLNLLLIPRFGAEGAAIATVVGQCGFAGMTRLSLRARPG